MLRGLFSSKAGEAKKELKHNAKELLYHMVSRVVDENDHSMLTAKVVAFTKQSAEKQVDQLPQTYLLVEQYVTDLNHKTPISKVELRKDIIEKFPFATEIDSLAIVLKDRSAQPIELSKIFILSVLERSYELLGAAGDKMLISLRQWIESLPEKAYLPIPFQLDDKLPKTAEKWYDLLFDISHELFSNLEGKFSESFTRKIYDKSYDEIARQYQALDDFPMMIRLLPSKILDASQVDKLSQSSKQTALSGQVDDLTALNNKISAQAEELRSANEIISLKNREITESIDYAKRIQFSMMPRIDEFSKIFKKSFIFFKPRDIVSGDFYWFKKIDYRDPKMVIAAVDCTGHGVPGAFMSLIGIEQFERIVNQQRIIDPAEICQRIHKNILKLSKRKTDELQDGMDLSICTIHKKRKILEFSGAKNSLIFFQNGNMKIFKGDRNAIGEELGDRPAVFTKQFVKVDQPTTCYLFSDGYQDQIGGPKDRKFMRKRFYKLLEHIHELPMKNQFEILEKELRDWMNPDQETELKQLDDILVMGFKIDLS